jgi:hypothetical protein
VEQAGADHSAMSRKYHQKIEQRLYKLLLKIAQSSLDVIKPSRFVNARKARRMRSNKGESPRLISSRIVLIERDSNKTNHQDKPLAYVLIS